jgi:hypothetical protein
VVGIGSCSGEREPDIVAKVSLLTFLLHISPVALLGFFLRCDSAVRDETSLQKKIADAQTEIQFVISSEQLKAIRSQVDEAIAELRPVTNIARSFAFRANLRTPLL